MSTNSLMRKKKPKQMNNNKNLKEKQNYCLKKEKDLRLIENIIRNKIFKNLKKSKNKLQKTF